MQVIFFSSDINMIDEWKRRHKIGHTSQCRDIDSLIDVLELDEEYILIADFDSVASEINTLLSSNSIPKNLIILEKKPEIATGKMLILHGVKAYGNSRMLTNHYTQMIKTVSAGDVWTYPELTIALAKTNKKLSLNSDSLTLIQNRLSNKELEVVYLILNGFSNDTIASELDITTRTVKAHVSSIFSKLHVQDRISLVLLLK